MMIPWKFLLLFLNTFLYIINGDPSLTIYGLKSASITGFNTICSDAFSDCAPFGWDENGKYNWTKRATREEVPATFFAFDKDARIIYALDKGNQGGYLILKIEMNVRESNPAFTDEWNTTVLFECDAGIDRTYCQTTGLDTFFQAVAFDRHSQTFWWHGMGDATASTFGFWSLDVSQSDASPVYHDWCTPHWTLKRQLGQAKIYNGYLWVVETLKDGLTRYNLTSGVREVVIPLGTYNFTDNQEYAGSIDPNMYALAFDETNDLMYFSVHDNFVRYYPKIYSRPASQISVVPYTEYELGSGLLARTTKMQGIVRGISINDGKEMYYTYSGSAGLVMSRILLDEKYPPHPNTWIWCGSGAGCDAGYGKHLYTTIGDRLETDAYYPTQDDRTETNFIVDWLEEDSPKVIWLHYFYQAQVHVVDAPNIGKKLTGQEYWGRKSGNQRYHSIYLDRTRLRLWILDSYNEGGDVEYIDMVTNIHHTYYTCPSLAWYPVTYCQEMISVCNHDQCMMTVDEDNNMMYILSRNYFYYFDLTRYEEIDPRTKPTRFDFNSSLMPNNYKAGKMQVLGNYLYFAEDSLGIVRKKIDSIGVDESTEIFVDNSEYENAKIKCYDFDIVLNKIYICVGNTIYVADFNYISDSSISNSNPFIWCRDVSDSGCSSSSKPGNSAVLHSIAIDKKYMKLYVSWYESKSVYNVVHDLDTSLVGACDPCPMRYLDYTQGAVFKSNQFLFVWNYEASPAGSPTDPLTTAMSPSGSSKMITASPTRSSEMTGTNSPTFSSPADRVEIIMSVMFAFVIGLLKL